jgi:hypothetical protein
MKSAMVAALCSVVASRDGRGDGLGGSRGIRGVGSRVGEGRGGLGLRVRKLGF